jgi:hypothetical protein
MRCAHLNSAFVYDTGNPGSAVSVRQASQTQNKRLDTNCPVKQNKIPLRRSLYHTATQFMSGSPNWPELERSVPTVQYCSA